MTGPELSQSPQQPAVDFGLFDWIDTRSGVPVADLYEDRIRFVQAAEDAGFHAYHLAEHHSTTLGMAPSPSVFMAALAQRTTRIRLIPLVYLLPLYSPFRLTEEICMLDHLSRGRLEFGVGRGASRWEAKGFSVDAEQAKGMMTEGLEAVIGGLRTGVVDFEGTHYQYDKVQTVIRPMQDPHPALWYAAGSPETVTWSARNNLNIMSNLTGAQFAEFVQLFHRTRAQGLDPEPINPHVARPKVGLNRQIFVAPTDREALERARSAYERFYHSFTSLWHENGDFSVDRVRAGFDVDLERGILVIGSPAHVQDRLGRDLADSGANYITGSFAWGDLSLADAIGSIELFASEVIPGLAGTSADVLAASAPASAAPATTRKA